MASDVNVLAAFPGPDARLSWLNAPMSWQLVSDATGELEFVFDAKTDFWKRTYYTPSIDADNGHVYGLTTSEPGFMAECHFTLYPVHQFDQAGLYLRIDGENWIKTGIEFVDGQARISCVVTNAGYSDWSTQPVPFASVRDGFSLHLRLHRRGTNVVCEYRRADTDSGWDFFRIAHLGAATPSTPCLIGAYGAGPTAGGGRVRVHRLLVQRGGEHQHRA